MDQLGGGGIPTTFGGALIFGWVTLLGVVVWVVKMMFSIYEKQGARMEAQTKELADVVTHLKMILNHLQQNK